MRRKKSFKRFIIKWHAIVAVTVIFAYSLIMNWYFVRGLDQSNFMNLNLEVKHFVKAYNNQKNPELPDSIHFKGYLNWANVPTWIQAEFPHLKNVSQLEMADAKIFNHDIHSMFPEVVVFMVAQPLKDGNTFYLTRQIDPSINTNHIENRIFTMFKLTWPLALAFLLLIHLAVQLVIRRLTQPMEALAHWADSLSLKDIGKPAPEFGFEELNQIASLQQAAFTRIANVLDKEQDFLRNASHELRTPIAVVKSNAELLTRVLTDKKASTCVERITRAALNMQHMSETLLWLSRDDNQTLDKSEVDISELLRNLVSENQYLLQSKSVDVHMEIENIHMWVAATPCGIVLSNLIRNAFQYTAEGKIEISLYKSSVVIKNTNQHNQEVDHTGADYGFGLGLNLVEKIVDKMNWKYENLDFQGGRNVMVDFAISLNSSD